MNAFDLLKLGQQRAQLKSAARRFKCDKCSQSFGNAGALATHEKSHPVFKGAQKAQPRESHVLDLLERKKKKKRSHKPSSKPEKVPRVEGDKNVRATRHRYSNLKKLRLLRQYDILKEEYPRTFREEWEVSINQMYYFFNVLLFCDTSQLLNEIGGFHKHCKNYCLCFFNRVAILRACKMQDRFWRT